MRKSNPNVKIVKLIKARKLFIETDNTVEEIAEEVKLDVEAITTLKESMIANIIEEREYLDNMWGKGHFEALNQENFLYLEVA